MTTRANRGSSKKKEPAKKGDANEKTPKKDDRGKKGGEFFKDIICWLLCVPDDWIAVVLEYDF